MPLVVSEVNPEAALSAIAERGPGVIIANPNCTTMAAMPVLKPLHDAAGLSRLIVTTFQAVSGSGLDGVAELDGQVEAVFEDAAALTHDGGAVRVPGAEEVRPADRVQRGRRRPATSSTTGPARPTRNRSCATSLARSCRSPSCWCPEPVSGYRFSAGTRCRSTPSSTSRISVARRPICSSGAPGVELTDVPNPLQAAGSDPSYVGRIRTDPGVPDGRGLVLFVSNDNLRKGAALNAVQIAEVIAAAR